MTYIVTGYWNKSGKKKVLEVEASNEATARIIFLYRSGGCVADTAVPKITTNQPQP